MSRLLSRLRRTEPTAPDEPGQGHSPGLAARVSALEDAVEENRRLNQRLADVVDVVTELLVPALDRDDARVAAALADLNKTLDEG
jgi:hypothetical protein